MSFISWVDPSSSPTMPCKVRSSFEISVNQHWWTEHISRKFTSMLALFSARGIVMGTGRYQPTQPQRRSTMTPTLAATSSLLHRTLNPIPAWPGCYAACCIAPVGWCVLASGGMVHEKCICGLVIVLQAVMIIINKRVREVGGSRWLSGWLRESRKRSKIWEKKEIGGLILIEHWRWSQETACYALLPTPTFSPFLLEWGKNHIS